MATVPLLVDGGVFTVGSTPTDFSDAIESATISVDADEVEIPATLATPKSTRLGARVYKLKLKWLSNDTSLTTELAMVLWTAITTSDGLLAFTLQLRPGAASASNPKWTGTFIASSSSVGADVGGLSEGDGEFTLTAMPVRATS